MTNRLRAMQRVLKVQTQMHRLAQWKLAALEQKEISLQDRQQHLLRFLDEEGAYSAFFSATLMRRLHAIDEEKAKLSILKAKQSDVTIEDARRTGLMQRMVDDLNGVAKQADDRKELRDILEQINQRRSASLR
jgi:hypothetical protein